MFTDIVSLLIEISLLQGTLLSVLLFFQKDRSANKYLAGILIFLIWTQFEFLLVRNRMEYDFILLFATRLGSWLVLGPLFIFYTRSLLDTKFKFRVKDLIHFAPFILFTLVIPIVVRELIPDRAVHYGILSLLKYYSLGTTPMQALYALLFIFQFVHLLVYLLFSKRKMGDFIQKLKSQYSNLDTINMNWIKNLNGAFMIVVGCVSLFFIVLFAFNIYKREFDYLYVLPVSFVIYWVAFKLIRHPEIIRSFAEVSDSPSKYEKSSLTQEQGIAYKDSISNYMVKQKPYLNNELKLNDLGEALDIHPHHISQVLNDQFKLSFFDFVNKYRVEEAKKRFKQKNGETILQIAYEVGFNNKASFNNYFKKITNQTPSQFIREHSS